MNSGAVLIMADVWKDDLILPDIWYPAGIIPTPEALGARLYDYYIKQMNFTAY